MDIGSLRNPLNSVNSNGFSVGASKLSVATFVALAVGCLPLTARAGMEAHLPDAPAVAAHWTFGQQSDGSIVETVSGIKAQPKGSAYRDISPVGDALEFDGYTGSITTRPVSALDRTSDIAVSVWVQLDAYPWNRVPILDQETSRGSFFFGIDDVGHLILKIGSSNQSNRSESSVPLRQWTLVTVALTNGSPKFTINGIEAKTLPVADPSVQASPHASSNDLIIGHVRTPLLPGQPKSIHPLLPVEYSIEGSLGELTIYQSPPSLDQIKTLLSLARPELLKLKPWAPLPRWTAGPGSFGAFYTTLHFDLLWDKTRRVGPDSDVVVRFPDSSAQLIFWQGNNYVPAWVTENNHWYTDEFMEIFGHPRCPYGEDCEPMSDKQVRYSHVRVLESTPARVVVHWRYALSEVQNYVIGDADSPMAWGDWADEYWTIYPDHVAARRSVFWSTAAERDKAEFQESIVIVPAGEKPEDSIHLDALTFANLQGETATYSWQRKTAEGFTLPKGPSGFPKPANPAIQWVNLKSQWKPFEILWGEPVTADAYNGEPSISSFEWWNHWPVAQIPSSGRPALAADRPGHTSLSHLYWPAYQRSDQTLTKLLLTGLTTMPAADLIPLAKSWRSPAEMQIEGGGAVPFDQAQRAYVFPADLPASIRFTVHASKEHPLEHMALVIPGWDNSAKLKILRGAQPVEFQRGTVNDLEGSRLVLYIPIRAENDVEFEMSL